MSKKLTLNTMKDIATPQHSPIIIPFYNENGEPVNIEFDTYLSLTEMSRFVDAVADGVFTYLDDYIPEYRDVWTFIALIQISNIPIPKKKTEDGDSIIDIKTAYEWMQKLGIVERLKNQDETLGDLLTLFDKLDRMITDKIKFKKAEILALPKAEFQNVCSTVENFFSMISEFGEKFKMSDSKEWLETAKKIASKDEKEITNAIIDFNTRKEVEVETEDKTEE